MTRRLRAAAAPYVMILPGGLWLALFFVIPLFVMLSLSTQEGNLIDGFRQTLHWANYRDVWDLYHQQLLRSLWYGGVATVIALLLAYPMSYWIAFYGGRHKSTYLFIMLLPFFVTFVLRTVAWEFLLGDNGLLLGPLRDAGVVSQSFHVLATSWAVIAGLVYNFLPFMVLPIYVALERVDPALLEAAGDLYANRRETFLHVVFPLTIPGVFAGVLLTFVPATADYVNASVLGGTGQTMIGNVIQTLYLENSDYPSASALSVILMAVLLVGIFLYARALGTRHVFEATAA